MSKLFTCYIIGEETLLIKCSEVLLERGHKILGVVTPNPMIKNWAGENNIDRLELNNELLDRLSAGTYDYLFSITNLSILPDELIDTARKGVINFHDGPLPKYAGTNATSWAIMNQEKTHGITWHKINSDVDKGDIFKQVVFDIEEQETSLSLNAKCFESGLSSFTELVEELSNGGGKPVRQDFGKRSFFGKFKRPNQAAVINWRRSAAEISALIRGLDFGRYKNPLGLPKIKVGDEYFIIQEIAATEIPSVESPGVITSINDNQVRVATGTKDVEFTKGASIDGVPLSIAGLKYKYSLKSGFKFDHLDDKSGEEITKLNAAVAKKEAYWVKRLSALEFVELHYARKNIALEIEPSFKNEPIGFGDEILGFFMKLDSDPQISLASAFEIFVGRHCGKNDFNIGFSHATLMEDIGEHDSLFSEYVPLEVEFDPDTRFTKTLAGLSSAIEKAVENYTYSLDIWGRFPGLEKHSGNGRRPISPVNIIFSENIEEVKPQPGSIITLAISKDLKFCSFIFDSKAINEANVKLYKAQLHCFLQNAAANDEQTVSEISILSNDERSQLLEDWNDTQVDFPVEKCVHQLFEDQAAKTPNAVAIVYKGNNHTYRELNERCNQMAHRLRREGVGVETLVGVCLHRSLDMLVAVMGTLKAGGAYVPLDPSFPKERISYMVENSECSVILTDKKLKDELGLVNTNIITVDTQWNNISKEKSTNPDSRVAPENLSYVIYTSGSTGKPKGVMIEHRNVVNFFTGMDGCGAHDPDSTWLAVTSLSFDISVLELLWTLARGFRVVIYTGVEGSTVSEGEGDRGKENNNQARSIPELIEQHKVTHFQCTPSMASMLMLDEDAKDAFGRLKKLLIGGEAFPAALAEQMQKVVPGDIINMYGPTETTVWSTTYKLGQIEQSILIGRPIANTTIYILDTSLQPVPVGVPGELLIGGAGVVRGYFKRPNLTAERFIRNPFSDDPDSRLYRTGDLARYLPDGNIDFMGRSDFQIKIRGYRIELGEIEAVLNEHPIVHESVVIAREDVSGQKRLVAYVIPGKGKTARTSDLREYAKGKLPDYMVPAHVVFLDAFPQTPNKKIDRKALPMPDMDRIERGAEFNPPRSDIEEAVAGLWAEILGVEQVGRDENFFDMGGESLSATLIILSIKRACEVDLPLHSLFSAPTVAALAEKLEAEFLKQAESGYTIADPHEGIRPPAGNLIDIVPPVSSEEEYFEPPRTSTEKTLAAFWEKFFRVERVGRTDHFFHLGGKSITAVNLLAQIEAEFGKRLPLSIMLHAPTLYQLADVIDEDSCQTGWSPLVPVQPHGTNLPFFCIHAHRGNVLNYYPLAQCLGSVQPFYGLQARGLDGEDIAFRTFTDMAADYLNEIRTVQPVGPYFIGGWCMGGYIALEMAHLIESEGDEVALVALIDAAHPDYPRYLPHATAVHRQMYKILEKSDYEIGLIRALAPGTLKPHLVRKTKSMLTPPQVLAERFFEITLGKLPLKILHSQAYYLNRLYGLHDKACKAYKPRPYSGRVAIFRASRQPRGIQPDPALGWDDFLVGDVEHHEIPGHYLSILVEPGVQRLAEELRVCLDR